MIHAFDAIIIGAGPAGALTARHMCDLGWRVALVEQGPRFRNKACGGCLSGSAVTALAELGLTRSVMGIAAGVTRRFRAHVGDDATLAIDLERHGEGGRASGLVVARSRLDQMLIDDAASRGASVFQPARARIVALERRRSAVEVRKEHGETEHLEAPLIVGADGLASRTAMAAGLARRRRRGRNRAAHGFSFELRDAAVSGPDGFDRDAIEMFIGTMGYLGIVRTGAGACHLAAYVRRGSPAGPVGFVRAMAASSTRLKRLGLFEADRDRLSEMRGSGPMPWRPQAIANGRVALVGDAAGYLEPITGEGMHWAMEAAAALAETVTGRPAGTWNDRMARAYSAGWRARLAGGQRTCAWLGWLLRHQTMCRAAFAIMNRDQGLAQRLADRVVTT